MILFPPQPYAFSRPLRSPVDLIAGDPVVRLAVEAPIADRGVETYGLAVEDQGPFGRRQRCDHLRTAATAAQVIGDRESHRHVEPSLLHRGRKAICENWCQAADLQEGVSLRIKALSTTITECISP